MNATDLLYRLAETADMPWQARGILHSAALGRGEGTVEAYEAWKQEQRGRTYTVAVFDCAQAFGGREEGGWWYDTGSLARIVRAFRGDEYAAQRYANRLNKRMESRRFGPNEGRRSYTSVLSDGEYRAMVFDGAVPEAFPARRPRYE